MAGDAISEGTSMSMFPCDLCSQRYVGKANYLYPAVLAEGDRRGERQRLCPPCASQLADMLDARFTPFPDGALDQVYQDRRCRYCLSDRTDGEGALVIAVLYQKAKEARNWGGFVCGDHVGQATSDIAAG